MAYMDIEPQIMGKSKRQEGVAGITWLIVFFIRQAMPSYFFIGTCQVEPDEGGKADFTRGIAEELTSDAKDNNKRCGAYLFRSVVRMRPSAIGHCRRRRE